MCGYEVRHKVYMAMYSRISVRMCGVDWFVWNHIYILITLGFQLNYKLCVLLWPHMRVHIADQFLFVLRREFTRFEQTLTQIQNSLPRQSFSFCILNMSQTGFTLQEHIDIIFGRVKTKRTTDFCVCRRIFKQQITVVLLFTIQKQLF